MEEIEATQHSYERAKERFSWKKRTLDRMMKKAYNEGITHADTVGSLSSYITEVWAKYKSANNIRIYGENIYLFRFNKLITLYRLPTELTKHVKNFK